MTLINQCNQKIKCSLENTEFYLMPYEERTVLLSGHEFVLTLSHLYGSSYGTCFDLDNVLQIVISSSFTIKEVNEQSFVYINREKVHFELYYTYDRFFCKCKDCKLVNDKHQVTDIDALIDIINIKHHDSFTERFFSFFFLDSAFGGATVLFFMFKLIFWLNNWSLSWWYIFVFWIIGFGLQVLNEKLFYKCMKKKEPQKISNLKRFSSDNFIKEYFSNPKRDWIGNDIEVD